MLQRTVKQGRDIESRLGKGAQGRSLLRLEVSRDLKAVRDQAVCSSGENKFQLLYLQRP